MCTITHLFYFFSTTIISDRLCSVALSNYILKSEKILNHSFSTTASGVCLYYFLCFTFHKLSCEPVWSCYHVFVIHAFFMCRHYVLTHNITCSLHYFAIILHYSPLFNLHIGKSFNLSMLHYIVCSQCFVLGLHKSVLISQLSNHFS